MLNKIKFIAMAAIIIYLDGYLAWRVLPQIEEPIIAAWLAAVLGFVWLACIRLEWFARFRRAGEKGGAA